jgi:hypothetical protein
LTMSALWIIIPLLCIRNLYQWTLQSHR